MRGFGPDHVPTLGRIILASLLINILSLAVPLTVLQIYDRILPNQSYGTATLLIAGATVAVLLEALLRYARTWLLAAAASNTEKSSYSQLVNLLGNASSSQIKAITPKGVQNALDSVSKVKDLYSGGLVSGLVDLPFALIFLGLVGYVGGELVLVPIVVWLITFMIVWGSSLRSKKISEVSAQHESSRSAFLLLMTRTLQGIKRQAVESRIYSQFKQVNRQRSLTKAAEDQQNAVAQECIQLASMATSVVLVIVGSLWVLDGQLTTGGLAACSILSGRAVAPLSALVGLRVKLNTMHSAHQAIAAVELAAAERPTQPVPSFVEQHLSLELVQAEVRRFTHRYRCSGEFKSADVVRIQSDSPYVASQVLACIAGLDDFETGDCLINQDKHHLASYSAYIGSHGQLLTGSILDNLCGFEPTRLAAVYQYSASLGLNAVVTRLPEGLETRVGVNPASQISQGSVQLINLVAQLSTGKSLLLVDKPETDLDIDSIDRLAKQLKQEAEQGKLVVVVSDHPKFVEIATTQLQVESLQEASV